MVFPDAKDLEQKGKQAFAWDIGGKLVAHLSSFIVVVILARLLPPEDFGVIALVMVMAGIAQILMDAGLGASLIQRSDVLPVHYSSVFFFNILVGCFLSLVIYSVSEYAGIFFKMDILSNVLQVVSVIFLSNAFGSVQYAKLRKELKYNVLAKANISASILSGLIGVGLVYSGFGIWGLVSLVLVRSIFFNSILWFISNWRPSMQFSFSALAQLWSFGFRVFLIDLMEAVSVRLDVMVIGRLYSPTILGYFDRAKSLDQMIIQYSSGSLMAVLFPLFSKIQTNLDQLKSMVIKIMHILCFFIFLLLGSIFLVSDELIIILYSERWISSIFYFKMLLLGSFAYPVGALLVSVVSSRGNSRTFLKLEVYKKTLMIGNVVVAFNWGIEGYLYGFILVSFLMTGINVVFSAREMKISPWELFSPLFVQILITVCSVLGVIWIVSVFISPPWLIAVVKIAIYIVLYVAANIMFKTKSYRSLLSYAFSQPVRISTS